MKYLLFAFSTYSYQTNTLKKNLSKNSISFTLNGFLCEEIVSNLNCQRIKCHREGVRINPKSVWHNFLFYFCFLYIDIKHFSISILFLYIDHIRVFFFPSHAQHISIIINKDSNMFVGSCVFILNSIFRNSFASVYWKPCYSTVYVFVCSFNGFACAHWAVFKFNWTFAFNIFICI